MGSAVARAFADAGTILQVADLDAVAAARVAAATGAGVCGLQGRDDAEMLIQQLAARGSGPGQSARTPWV